jgi:hypothetical protein
LHVDEDLKLLNLLAHPTRFEGVTFAFGAQRSIYAASRGIARSTNRKNRVLWPPATNDSCDTSEGDPEGSPFAFRSGRVLRPPATNDPGDSEFPGAPVPFRRDRVLRVPDLNLLFYILRDLRRTIGGNIADLGRAGKSGNALRLP